MNLHILHGDVPEQIPACPSKSYAHRGMIAAALGESETLVACGAPNRDIEATARVLRALGARVDAVPEGFRIFPITAVPTQAYCDAGESGSTLRFLVPVAAALGCHARFVGHGKLPGRPMEPLYAALRAGGARITPLPDGVEVSGRLRAGTYTVTGEVSSQFISGLLFALPLLCGESRLILTGQIASLPYVEMTCQVLSRAGITLARTPDGFTVAGGQRTHSASVFDVEGDWSGAAFWLVAGAIGKHPVTVTGLCPDSLQGDRAILDLLGRMGAQVHTCGRSATVSPAPLHALDIDATQIPDLVPVLAVAAAAATGTTVIRGAARLRMKESDRLETTASLLGALGGQVRQTDDGLIITGTGSLTGGTVDGAGDHRIVMSAAIASLIASGPVEILGVEAVGKSYPEFPDIFSAAAQVRRTD